MTFQMQLALGWGAPPLEDQFSAFSIQVDEELNDKIVKWKRVDDAVTTLGISGYMPNSATKKAREKLAKSIEKHLVDAEYIEAVK